MAGGQQSLDPLDGIGDGAGTTEAPPPPEAERTPKRGNGGGSKPAAVRGKGLSGPQGGRPSKAALEGRLTETIQKAAAALAIVGLVNPQAAYDAIVLAENAEPMSRELMKLAAKNVKVAAAIDALYKGGEAFASLTVLLAVVVPILVNHGVLPRGLLTFVKAPAGMPDRPARKAKEEPPAPEPVPGVDDVAAPTPLG